MAVKAFHDGWREGVESEKERVEEDGSEKEFLPLT
jgi:hypothetical protein